MTPEEKREKLEADNERLKGTMRYCVAQLLSSDPGVIAHVREVILENLQTALDDEYQEGKRLALKSIKEHGWPVGI